MQLGSRLALGTAALLILVTTASCAKATPPAEQAGTPVVTAERREAIIRTIEALVAEITEASSNRDVERFYSFFSNEATAVINDRMVTSWPEHKQEGRKFFDSLAKAEYVADDIHVDVLSPDVAIYMGQHVFSGERRSGESLSSTFIQTWVFQRSGDTWEIAHAHLSEGGGSYDPYEKSSRN